MTTSQHRYLAVTACVGMLACASEVATDEPGAADSVNALHHSVEAQARRHCKPQRLEAVPISASGALAPQVGRDDAGGAVALWRQAEASGQSVYAARYARGTWSEPQRIQEDQSDVRSADLTVDRRGRAIAVWDVVGAALPPPPPVSVYAARLDGTWSAPNKLPDVGLQDFRLAGSRSGKAMVIGVTGNAPLSLGSWLVSAWFSGGQWQALSEPAPMQQQFVRSRDVAMNDRGDAVAVWAKQGAQARIWGNRFEAGADWGEMTGIAPDVEHEATEPRVALQPNGSLAVAAWTQQGSLWTSTSSGDAWSAPTEIANTGTIFDASLHVAMDQDGHALLVWQALESKRSGIHALALDAGSDGRWQSIEAGHKGDAQTPALAMAPNGTAIAVWTLNDGQHRHAFGNFYTPQSGWGTATRLDANDSQNADHPKVAIAADGSATVVWEQSDGESTRVEARSFERACMVRQSDAADSCE